MANKRSELAIILRRLADYIDHHPDEELIPIFEQAAALMRTAGPQKVSSVKSSFRLSGEDLREIAVKLGELQSRAEGESVLIERIPNRRGLETLARFLQLPVQRDD